MRSLWPAFCAGVFASVALADAAPADTTWYTIYTEGGTQIGYASHEVVRGAGITIIDTQEVDLQEEVPPAPLFWSVPVRADTLRWRTTTSEDNDGHVLGIDSVVDNGRERKENTVRIKDGAAEITHATPVETRTLTVALPQGVRFDAGDGLLNGWDPSASPKLAFFNFDADAMAVDRVTLEAAPRGAADPPDSIVVLRKHYEGSEIRGVTRLLLDRDRQIVQVRQPMFGNALDIRLSDEKTALSLHHAYRALINAMMKSPFLISQEAMRGHIRYRFAFRDDVAFSLPSTSEQRASYEPGFATVDVCGDCGTGVGGDEADLSSALRATAWLQSDAPEIREIAEPVAKRAVSDTEKMNILLDKARPYIRNVEFAGHHSALETMARRGGDCTDAAALLAAFGRAAGIPTRVASGLVYSRESYHGVSNVFMAHSWTLAYVDGHWKSFDLALDNFDATHIALTIGDGDDRSIVAAAQLAGWLKFDTMAEVRAAPQN